ncbi:hypothetical protein ANO11243_001350 [Dothideomycetidae sp. 11243]|nr:hypothetical protein ANO11243_001350 [fungal sp. No.11243]
MRATQRWEQVELLALGGAQPGTVGAVTAAGRRRGATTGNSSQQQANHRRDTGWGRAGREGEGRQRATQPRQPQSKRVRVKPHDALRCYAMRGEARELQSKVNGKRQSKGQHLIFFVKSRLTKTARASRPPTHRAHILLRPQTRIRTRPRQRPLCMSGRPAPARTRTRKPHNAPGNAVNNNQTIQENSPYQAANGIHIAAPRRPRDHSHLPPHALRLCGPCSCDDDDRSLHPRSCSLLRLHLYLHSSSSPRIWSLSVVGLSRQRCMPLTRSHHRRLLIPRPLPAISSHFGTCADQSTAPAPCVQRPRKLLPECRVSRRLSFPARFHTTLDRRKSHVQHRRLRFRSEFGKTVPARFAPSLGRSRPAWSRKRVIRGYELAFGRTGRCRHGWNPTIMHPSHPFVGQLSLVTRRLIHYSGRKGLTSREICSEQRFDGQGPERCGWRWRCAKPEL